MKYSSSSSRLTTIALAAGLFVCGIYLIRNLSSPRKVDDGTFWLIVEATFKNEADLATFQEAFKTLAEYVSKYEPNTLTYQVALSDSNPLKAVIVERYRTKDDYLQVHRTSEPFLKFRPILHALGPVINGHSYYGCEGIGFV